MNESLKKETEKLARSWMQHEAGWLRDYLVAGVEDPRINVQSILSRHFLIQAVTGESFGRLMRHEYRFAAMMNWLLSISEKATDPEELSAVLFGFRQGADDAEGIPIPHWALSIFATLPAKADGVEVPNYVEGFLNQTRIAAGTASPDQESLNTFCRAWRGALAPGPARCKATARVERTGKCKTRRSWIGVLAAAPTQRAKKASIARTAPRRAPEHAIVLRGFVIIIPAGPRP